MPKTKHDLGLKTSVENFDAFVRCTLMENQPWPQFQNGIQERSTGCSSVLKDDCMAVYGFSGILNRKVLALHSEASRDSIKVTKE